MKYLASILCLLACAALSPAAQQVITPNGGVTGSVGRDIINHNFTELYGRPAIPASGAGVVTVSAGTVTLSGPYLTPSGDGSGLTGLSKSQVGLAAVENTALSTWAGSSNITQVGTLGSGTIPWARLTGVPSYEPALGNPGTSGYVLSSTTGGTRSWIAASSIDPANVAITGGTAALSWLALGGATHTSALDVSGFAVISYTVYAADFYSTSGLVYIGNGVTLSRVTDGVLALRNGTADQTFWVGNVSGSAGGGSIVLNPGSAIGSPAEGQIYYDSGTHHFLGWTGSAWKQLDN